MVSAGDNLFQYYFDDCRMVPLEIFQDRTDKAPSGAGLLSDRYFSWYRVWLYHIYERNDHPTIQIDSILVVERGASFP